MATKNKLIIIKPCSCGGEVFFYKTAGGARKELPVWGAKCKACNVLVDNLGYNEVAAWREWNRKQMRERKVIATGHTIRNLWE